MRTFESQTTIMKVKVKVERETSNKERTRISKETTEVKINLKLIEIQQKRQLGQK